MRRFLETLTLAVVLAGVPALAKGRPKPLDGGVAVTPEVQGENRADLKLTQTIRQAVEGDNRLSFAAKNVKIITRDGRVTLTGEVKSNQERTLVREHATAAAGQDRVDDQLTVRGNGPSNF